MVRRSWHEIQNLGVLPEHPRDHVLQVLKEVEAVGDLHSARCCSTCGLGVLATTVPAHHLHPWVFREPPGKRVRAPVRQDVHQFTTFEIHQYRSVAGSATESEVVHTQYFWRLVILKLC